MMNESKLLSIQGIAKASAFCLLLSAFSVNAAMAAPAAGGAAAEAAEEKTEFDVVLTGFGDQKIKVIKVIREVMGLGLAEAKAAVEGAPTTMKEGLSKEDAEALKKQVEEVGGKVELK